MLVVFDIKSKKVLFTVDTGEPELEKGQEAYEYNGEPAPTLDHYVIEKGKVVVKAPKLNVEQTVIKARLFRDTVLSKTDFTQLADAPTPAGTTAKKWTDFRKKVRAVDLENPTWPATPSVKVTGDLEVLYAEIHL